MYSRLVMLATLLLAGCTSYTPYKEQLPSAKYASLQYVMVSVVDERVRVKRGKPRDFIGVYRRAFGIPVSKYVSDLSPSDPQDREASLAAFIERRLVDGMSGSGFVAARKTIEEPPEEDASIEDSHEGATKWLVLVLKEWYFSTDMHFINSFNFDSEVDILIYDEKAGLVLQKTEKHRDVIPETSQRQNDVMYAYKARLTEFLNDKDVRKALE